jgi:hypothetical protein
MHACTHACRLTELGKKVACSINSCMLVAGSGGKIEARFVNQTASVNAKASIGMFPKRSSGGAAGGGNCQGGELRKHITQ